jgi:hypothetical protein
VSVDQFRRDCHSAKPCDILSNSDVIKPSPVSNRQMEEILSQSFGSPNISFY